MLVDEVYLVDLFPPSVILNLFQDNSAPDRVMLNQVQHDGITGITVTGITVTVH